MLMSGSAFLVELFPYAQRARGIAIFQFFGKGAQFFGTNVNPIGKVALRGTLPPSSYTNGVARLRGYGLEVPSYLLLLDRRRGFPHLLAMARDLRPHP